MTKARVTVTLWVWDNTTGISVCQTGNEIGLGNFVRKTLTFHGGFLAVGFLVKDRDWSSETLPIVRNQE